MTDEDVKALGFAHLAEFCSMVASVDLSTPIQVSRFEKWRDEDGTKDGLLALMGVSI
jgi:hypothetical protein